MDMGDLVGIGIEAKGLHNFAKGAANQWQADSGKPQNVINVPRGRRGILTAVGAQIRLPRAQSVQRARNNICIAVTAGAQADIMQGEMKQGFGKGLEAGKVAVIAEAANWGIRAVARPLGAAAANAVCHIGVNRAVARKVVERVVIIEEGIKRLNRLADRIGGEYCPEVIKSVILGLQRLVGAPFAGLVNGVKEEVNALNKEAQKNLVLQKILEQERLEALKTQDEAAGIDVNDDYIKTEIRKALAGNPNNNNSANDPTERVADDQHEVSEAEDVMAEEAQNAPVQVPADEAALKRERRRLAKKAKKQLKRDAKSVNVSDENLRTMFKGLHKGGAQIDPNFVDSIIDDYFFKVDINGQTYLAEPREIPVINKILSSNNNSNNNSAMTQKAPNGGTRKTRKSTKRRRTLRR